MKLKRLLPLGCLTLACGITAAAQEAAPVNVLLNKTVVEVAGKPAADSEGPEKLIDGDLNTKYCIIQSSPYIVIDAEGYYNFTSFKFYDCKTNENEENASVYTLQLSKDGKSWETAAEAQNVADVDLKEINLTAPVKARFVRFAPTYRDCARMWELEGYGTDATTLVAELQTTGLELNINESGEIKVAYTLKAEKASDFSCLASCDRSNVEIGTPVEADGTFTIPVKAITKGSVKVTVSICNDGEKVDFEIPVKVKSDAPVSTADAVSITTWKIDMVAESLSEDSFNDGISFGWYDSKTFYSAAVAADGALCDEEGVVETSAGNVYVIPVDQNNAVCLERYEDDAVLTFAEPIPTEKVNLLVFADTEDGIAIKATIIYEDGSESDPVQKTIGSVSYETEDGQEALAGLGMVINSLYDGVKLGDAKNHRVYEMEIPADQYKNIKEIKANVEGGGYGDAAYIIGVNAHNVNGVVTKHLDASLAEQTVKVKTGQSTNVVVNYTLTDVEGLTDELTFSAVATKSTIKVGEIAHNKDAHTLTIPVEGVAPSLANVEINLGFGAQSIKLVAQVLVKTVVIADDKNCIEISNWKHDVIAEAQPASQYATQKLDNDGWVFFTDDVHPEGAIAGDERLIVAASGNVYRLAPYDSNNGTMILGYGAIDSKEDFNFASPIFTDKVNILATSANGVSKVEIVVNYEDGTSESANKVDVEDWHANEADGTEAMYGLGRVNINSNDIASERRFRLFEVSADTKRDSKVKSLTINNKGYQSYLTVLGVNAEDKQTSGIDDIESGNTAKTIDSYFNLQGQKVENPVSGIYVVRYTDGSYAKVVIK